MSKSTFKNRGFVWFSDAKLRHKKAGRKQNPVGVKFLGVSCKEVAFLGSFWGKMVKFLGVFGSFWEFSWEFSWEFLKFLGVVSPTHPPPKRLWVELPTNH